VSFTNVAVNPLFGLFLHLCCPSRWRRPARVEMSTKLPVLVNVGGGADASKSSSTAASKVRTSSAKPKPLSRPPSHRPPVVRRTNTTSGTDALVAVGARGGGAAAAPATSISATVKELSPEMQHKWSRVKARFNAVAASLPASELKVSIAWNNGNLGTTVASPKRNRVTGEEHLSYKSSSKFSNVSIDRSEPLVVQARTLFDLFDEDKSGHLDRLEFKKLVRAVGGDVGLSGAEFSRRVKADFDEIDVGHDSAVSFAEFHRYYRFLHKEVIAQEKRASREQEGQQPAQDVTAQKDNEFFGKNIHTLDDAIRAGNMSKVVRCLKKGEHFASGGVVPVVLAAHLGCVHACMRTRVCVCVCVGGTYLLPARLPGCVHVLSGDSALAIRADRCSGRGSLKVARAGVQSVQQGARADR
jgi:hypothetical protein